MECKWLWNSAFKQHFLKFQLLLDPLLLHLVIRYLFGSLWLESAFLMIWSVLISSKIQTLLFLLMFFFLFLVCLHSLGHLGVF